MPNWTDKTGFSWFSKLECKRCLGVFEQNEKGEVPIHKCLGGYYTSETVGDTYHYPVKVSSKEVLKKKEPNG